MSVETGQGEMSPTVITEGDNTSVMLDDQDLKFECLFQPSAINCMEYTIALWGIFANAVAVGRIHTCQEMRTVIFTTIACLAMADLCLCIFIITRVTWVQLESCETVYHFSLKYKIYHTTIMFICQFSSFSHVTLISIVRYLTLVHPLHSMVWLSNLVVLRTSALIWISGLVLGSSFLLCYELIPDFSRFNSRVYFVVMLGLTYILPTTITSVFHIAKMMNLNSSTLRGRPEILIRMSRMVTTIIVTSILLIIPEFVIILLFGIKLIQEDTFDAWVPLGTLGVAMSSSLNPVIYAFMSREFRQSLFRIFHRRARGRAAAIIYTVESRM